MKQELEGAGCGRKGQKRINMGYDISKHPTVDVIVYYKNVLIKNNYKKSRFGLVRRESSKNVGMCLKQGGIF